MVNCLHSRIAFVSGFLLLVHFLGRSVASEFRNIVVLGEGARGITLGMSKQDVSQRMGVPRSLSDDGWIYYLGVKRERSDMALMFDSGIVRQINAQGPMWTVNRIPFGTAGGVGRLQTSCPDFLEFLPPTGPLPGDSRDAYWCMQSYFLDKPVTTLIVIGNEHTPTREATIQGIQIEYTTPARRATLNRVRARTKAVASPPIRP